MVTPTYSIIIPTLNEETFLPHLLDSLVAQSIKRFEVIVVDGNSSDNTQMVARSYESTVPAMKVIVCTKAGISAQRNIGAKAAKGKWLIFIDADSILLPFALERIDTFVERNHPTFFTTWFRPDTDEIGDAMVTLLFNASYEAAQLVKRPYTQGTFAAVTADVFQAVGGYDESIVFGEDYDLTKRICEKGNQLHMLRETIYIYSLRRFRHQGTLQSMQNIARALFSVLLRNKTPRFIPGYEMGGHLYRKRKRKIRSPMIKQFNKKFRELFSELLRS